MTPAAQLEIVHVLMGLSRDASIGHAVAALREVFPTASDATVARFEGELRRRWAPPPPDEKDGAR